jgi:hypothetical protein
MVVVAVVVTAVAILLAALAVAVAVLVVILVMVVMALTQDFQMVRLVLAALVVAVLPTNVMVMRVHFVKLDRVVELVFLDKVLVARVVQLLATLLVVVEAVVVQVAALPSQQENTGAVQGLLMMVVKALFVLCGPVTHVRFHQLARARHELIY